MKIGENIQLHREQRGMSQQELADKLGVTRQSISKWENDTALPSFKSVLMIGNVFNLSLDELVRGDDRLIEEYQKGKSFQLSPTEKVVFSIIGISILAFILVSTWPGFFRGEWQQGIFEFAQLVAFVALMMNVPWRDVNKLLRNRRLFWILLIWVLLAATPYIVSATQSTIAGYMQGAREYQSR
ncbi:helix-turn-helix transcriptional regulator [Weissella confusa]|uniref:helix-turn-helix domain-containing protein n=1 Tax=Weissella confusa TaxID=1583 RepID=UPI0018F1F011|nr:helix-turn-helix transcriptional regulator [Weissella confusa]MBJ7646722.1 helix-turn-helix transcriptional regulator [Weissella confusa]MBJ7679215.1 helix-turn-helix transcriptional regulator [Weissella confusa]